MNPIFALFSPGLGELLVIGVIAVLLFGKRLPEVGRSLGRSLTEFKKGLSDIQSEIHNATTPSSPSSSTSSHDWGGQSETAEPDREEPTAPKFEPPATEPREQASTS